jgi:hypothetical protein
MNAAAEPIGPENDFHLQRLEHGAGVVVAAWGVHGTHRSGMWQCGRRSRHCII